MGRGNAAKRAATRREEVRVSHELEMEDYMVDLRRKVAIVEEQNQALREQNSRLTLALDEALSIARKYRNPEGYEL
jgi:hypothetical protein